MILVDTSVWIDHFRKPSVRLTSLLNDEEVLVHPFVIGEVACGNLKNRTEIIGLLRALPQAQKADDDDILFFIERHGLNGRGVGWIDIHLLASCHFDHCCLWSVDKKLKVVAQRLRVDITQH